MLTVEQHWPAIRRLRAQTIFPEEFQYPEEDKQANMVIIMHVTRAIQESHAKNRFRTVTWFLLLVVLFFSIFFEKVPFREFTFARSP